LAAVLLTKLYIPRRRPDSVSRPRLVARLNAEAGQRVTLISAPAGFGKTTLLAEWIPASPHCVTWLSLDEGDNDPTVFWGGFLAALQRLDPSLGEGARSQLEAPQSPPIETLLAQVINDLSACPISFIHVFDDYHFIQNPAINEAVSFLLEHMPPNLRMILSSRADPALPLARWRGRGQLAEIRASDLRFTVAEVAAFLKSRLLLELPPTAIAALESRTEGWAAGLQLAALSMQGREDVSGFIEAFSGSHRHVLNYLVGEVLDQRPRGTLDFLRQTSILDRMCAPLVEAVTGTSGGQAMLETLDRANMFVIPLDDEGRWYRYHHLFAEALQQRFHQAEREQAAEYYRRASEWFERSGSSAEAVEYALRGRDWPRAAALIETTMPEVQRHGELATLLRWLGALPDEAIATRPTLGLAHAWLLIIVDDFVGAERRLAVSDQALRAHPEADPAVQNALLGQAAVVRATSALMLEAPGEVTVAAGHDALRLLPEDDLVRRGFAVFIMGCAHYLSLGDVQAAESTLVAAAGVSRSAGDAFGATMAYLHLSQMRAMAGHLGAAAAACEELSQLAHQPGWEHFPAAALGGVMLGRVPYERNELAAALETLTAALAEVERYSLKRPELIGVVLLARVKLALGAAEEARALLDRAWTTIQKYQLKQLTFPGTALRARMLLQMGDLATAAQWASTIAVPADGSLNPALEYDHITVARVWVAQGREAEARSLLRRLLPPAEVAGRMGRVIEILALQAVAAWAQQNEEAAMAALEKALALGEPEGFVRSFVDEGEPMQAMLARVTGERHWYAEQLLEAFGRDTASVRIAAAARTPTASLLEPLRERELEVLRLMAQGYSNQEIATKLVLGVSTIKTHINHLFQKLGAASRTQAIARGRALGLLDG
jgi:LuxR family maltose regulon positive regulatory protein